MSSINWLAREQPSVRST